MDRRTCKLWYWLVVSADLSAQNIYFRLVAADVAADLIARPAVWRRLRFELPSEASGR